MRRRHAVTLEDRAVKLDAALQALMSAALDYSKCALDTTKPRWQKNEARRDLVRASIRHANSVTRARRDRK